MQLRSRVVAREFKSADRPDLYAGTPPLEALKAIISIAASHSPEFFSLTHVDVSCAYFHAKAQEVRAGEIGSRRLLREGSRKNRIVDEEHVRYQRCSKQLGTRLARASRKLEPRAWAQCKKSVSRRRLHGGRIEGESVGAQEAAGERVSNQSEHHRAGSAKSIKALSRRICWGETGILYQHDPRHVDFLIDSLGLENRNTVQTRKVDDVNDENPAQLDPEQIGWNGSHVARCLFFSQDRADMTFAVNQLCQKMSDPTQLNSNDSFGT